MPAIILFLLFGLTGCFNSNKLNSVAAEQLSVSQFAYRGAVEKSIDLKFNVQKSETTEISVRANIPENYKENLTYKWSLGSGVDLESGLLSSSISPPKNGKVFLTIKVKNFNLTKTKYIRFEIVGTDPNRRIFADAILSSNQENSFEEIVKEIETLKKEEAAK